MTYLDYRDPILVHAKAAALAVDGKWTNVAIGMPTFNSSKGVRVFYGGEIDPPKFAAQRTLVGEMVGSICRVVTWFALSNLSTDAAAAIDTQAYGFTHELRTRITGDQMLGGAAGVDVEYVAPDLVVEGGTRYLVLDANINVGYTEYLY